MWTFQESGGGKIVMLQYILIKFTKLTTFLGPGNTVKYALYIGPEGVLICYYQGSILFFLTNPSNPDPICKTYLGEIYVHQESGLRLLVVLEM